jgi:hypothetical protein
MKKADNALYRGERQGRDRLCTDNPAPTSRLPGVNVMSLS